MLVAQSELINVKEWLDGDEYKGCLVTLGGHGQSVSAGIGHFSMDQLNRQPSEEEWSLGQMVQHLINSALHMQIRNMEQCMTEGESSAGEYRM